MYLQCPHKWKLNYIDKLEIKKESIQLIYGTSMHETIQQFLKHYYTDYTLQYIKSESKVLIAKYFDLMIQRMLYNLQQSKKLDPTLNITDAVLENNLEFALRLLEEFIPHCNKWFPKQYTELVGVEVQLNYQLQNIGLPFTGYIDVLIKNNKTGQYMLYDLKTSRMGWKDKQKKDQSKRLQLLLYKYFLSKQLDIPIESISVEFLILKKNVYTASQYKISRLQKFIPPNANATVKKAIKLFNDTIIDMQRLCQGKIAQPEKRVSGLCNYCPYKNTKLEGKVLCDQGKTLKKILR